MEAGRIRLPMFPLGTVVFPYAALPLRVFEPRYQTLLDRVLAGDRRFGITLIERGSEVGGGDQRFETGTMVEVVAVQDLPDNHRFVMVAGLQPIRVREWQADDPHPWAMIELQGLGTPPTVEETRLTTDALEKVLALASELGADVLRGVERELSGDPLVAAYQLAGLTPITPLDHQKLLECPEPSAMLGLMRTFLDEQYELLQARLAGR